MVMMRKQLDGPAAASGQCRTGATPVHPWLEQCFETAEEELRRLEMLFCGGQNHCPAGCPAGRQLLAGGRRGGGSFKDFAPQAVSVPPRPLSAPSERLPSNLVRQQTD